MATTVVFTSPCRLPDASALHYVRGRGGRTAKPEFEDDTGYTLASAGEILGPHPTAGIAVDAQQKALLTSHHITHSHHCAHSHHALMVHTQQRWARELVSTNLRLCTFAACDFLFPSLCQFLYHRRGRELLRARGRGTSTDRPRGATRAARGAPDAGTHVQTLRRM
jgi:hypothetical protein